MVFECLFCKDGEINRLHMSYGNGTNETAMTIIYKRVFVSRKATWNIDGDNGRIIPAQIISMNKSKQSYKLHPFVVISIMQSGLLICIF